MHSETEFHWSHIQNAYGSRIFIVTHAYGSESCVHGKHEIEEKYVITMYNYIIKHVVTKRENNNQVTFYSCT